MLDGVRRDKGASPDIRLPITLHHLTKIWEVLPNISSSQVEAFFFFVCFLLFFCFFENW